MVWGIARDHGGFATLDSRPGAGACVSLVLPRTTLPLAAPPSPAPASTVDGGLVLVVDDEPALRRSLMRTLERAGFTAEGAADGQAALDWLAARAGTARMVLLDVQMPGMSGLEVLAGIRASFPSLPVILMSGYSEERVPDEVLSDGATAFIGKPFEPAELIGVTRRVARKGDPPPGHC
jgi:two-component system cell cycle sensor histidine kinase/response regulator CckA